LLAEKEGDMPTDEPGSSTGSRRPAGADRTPWFGPNRSGMGYHPQTWQGWVILGAGVVALVVLVVLLRTGLL
jgi:hypothetical protein